jgi:hypothetical protein
MKTNSLPVCCPVPITDPLREGATDEVLASFSDFREYAALDLMGKHGMSRAEAERWVTRIESENYCNLTREVKTTCEQLLRTNKVLVMEIN